jgi:hypothetical protein
MNKIGVRRLRHAAAILASLGDVFHGTNFKRLGILAGLSRCASGRSTATSAARGPSNLYFVAHVLAQLRRISGELVGVAVFLAKRVIPAGATQSNLPPWLRRSQSGKRFDPNLHWFRWNLSWFDFKRPALRPNTQRVAAPKEAAILVAYATSKVSFVGVCT